MNRVFLIAAPLMAAAAIVAGCATSGPVVNGTEIPIGEESIAPKPSPSPSPSPTPTAVPTPSGAESPAPSGASGSTSPDTTVSPYVMTPGVPQTFNVFGSQTSEAVLVQTSNSACATAVTGTLATDSATYPVIVSETSGATKGCQANILVTLTPPMSSLNQQQIYIYVTGS